MRRTTTTSLSSLAHRSRRAPRTISSSLTDTPLAGVAGLPLAEASVAVPAPAPVVFALPPLVGDAAATPASGAIVPLAFPTADATPPPSVDVLVDPAIRTNYHPPSIPTFPPGHGPKQANTRRKNLPTGAIATCLVAPPPASAVTTRRFKGKGSKHANACPGPWVAALERMPPAPPTGSSQLLEMQEISCTHLRATPPLTVSSCETRQPT